MKFFETFTWCLAIGSVGMAAITGSATFLACAALFVLSAMVWRTP